MGGNGHKDTKIDRRLGGTRAGKVAPSFELRRQIDPKHKPSLLLIVSHPRAAAAAADRPRNKATNAYYIKGEGKS